MSKCIKNQVRPLENRICPISDCLEWRVAHWQGVRLYLQIKFIIKYIF